MTDELDLDSRELCPDGACTGVLGADGRCGECGRSRAEAAAGVELDATPDASESPGESFDDGRELCPDGACIGVIGPDGRCKECGRAREG